MGMGEAIFNRIWWLANVPFVGRWFLLVACGIRGAARLVLGKYYGITVTTGIEFCPERRTLDKYSDIEDILKDTETVFAFSVRGDKLITGLAHPERHIKKLLLPNPKCNSLKNLEVTTNRDGALSDSIKSVSKSAISKGINTRWYSEFVGYSLLIVEPNKSSGWLRVEWVLPYSVEHKNRPSIKIKKIEQPKAFEHFLETFNNMWDNAEEPLVEPSKKIIDGGTF